MFLHDYILACEISTVRSLAFNYLTNIMTIINNTQKLCFTLKSIQAVMDNYFSLSTIDVIQDSKLTKTYTKTSAI